MLTRQKCSACGEDLPRENEASSVGFHGADEGVKWLKTNRMPPSHFSSMSYINSDIKSESSGKRKKKKKEDTQASRAWIPEPLQSDPSGHHSPWSPGAADHRPNEGAASGWPEQQRVSHNQQSSHSQALPHVQYQAQDYFQLQAQTHRPH